MKVRHSTFDIRHSKILVVTGDPGGARVLIPAIRRLKRKHPDWKYRILAGPNSRWLWSAAGFKPKPWRSEHLNEDEANKFFWAMQPDVLVTGTSFENPTESWFRLAAKSARVPSFSALDHWSNYRERFEILKRGLILPDLIGVMDNFARQKMVKAGIPSRHLVVVGHPVLDPFLKKCKNAASGKKEVLFISEPISWDGRLNPKVVRYPRHNELTMIKRLFSVYRRCPQMLDRSLLIRPHPLEPTTRLSETVRRHAPPGLRVKIDRSRSLEEDFNRAGVVLGVTSIALLQAKLMGLPVLSLHPPHVRGWIPDDIICFLPSIRSNDCFIEAVSKFIFTGKTDGKLFYRGKPPLLPKNSAKRIASEIERLVDGKRT